MGFNDQLSQHYSEMLDGTYECVDRHANIPIITCKPQDKKHEIAAEYIPDDKNFSGIFLILKSRATSLVWEVEKAASGKIRNIKPQQPYPFVNNYWFLVSYYG